ncbi:hypothetical protein Pgin01_00842 [Porphyromonas gingivalis]
MLNNKTGSRKYSKRMDRLQLYESKKLRRETPLSPPFYVYLQGNQYTIIDPCIFATLPDLKT